MIYMSIFKFLLFILLTCITLTLIYLASAAIPLGALAFFDYRLVGWGSVVASVVWMFVLVPICLIIMGMIMAYLLRGKPEKGMTREERIKARNASAVSIFKLLFGSVVVGVPYGCFFFWILLPTLAFDERMHLTNWLSDLKLSHFTVCPTKVYPGNSSTTADGEITVEVVNTSNELIKEAIFTVETGGYWLDTGNYGTHITMANLQPNEQRRTVLRDYLGKIRARKGFYQAKIYWDAVYFTSGGAPRLTDRPANAQFKIVSCLPAQK